MYRANRAAFSGIDVHQFKTSRAIAERRFLYWTREIDRTPNHPAVTVSFAVPETFYKHDNSTKENRVGDCGSSGVGKATVQALLAEGVRVTAVARGEDRLR